MLEVPADSCVKINYINEVDIAHDFIIDEVEGENGIGYVHMLLKNSTDTDVIPYPDDLADDHEDDGDDHTDDGDDHTDDGDDHGLNETTTPTDNSTALVLLNEGHDDDVDPTPGKSFYLVKTPAKAAEFEFYCSIVGHKENGMFGTLKVTEGGFLNSLPGFGFTSVIISLLAIIAIPVIRRK